MESVRFRVMIAAPLVLAVVGDPLAGIKATERVLFVMRGGRVHRDDSAAGVPRP